jgi:glycosyltransferase involved in cell wall biosynthesis
MSEIELVDQAVPMTAATDEFTVAAPLPDDCPTVSLIVPCWNEVGRIRRCLECIEENDYPKDRLEIVIVDGMSQDGTRAILEEYVRSHPRIRVLDNPGRIPPIALNIGIAATQGEIVMRMDVHVEYPKDYISSLVRWLLTSGADNVGGMCQTCPSGEGVLPSAIAIGMSHPIGVGNSYFRIGGITRPRWVDTVPFGCLFRKTFEKIGRFDEEMIRDEDCEFNSRLLAAGGRILLVPDVVFRYYARDTLTKARRTFFEYGYYKPLAARKVMRIETARQLAPPLLVSSLLLSLVLLFSTAWGGAAIFFVVALYAACLCLGAIQVGIHSGVLTGLSMLLVFPTLHFGYGVGYLKGVFDFWILGRDVPEDRKLGNFNR